MNILPLTSPEDPDWLQLRLALWPDTQPEEHAEEMASFLAEPDKFAQLIAKDDEGKAWGFVEAALRTDYVNGTDSSPVAFLEGLYVKAPARKKWGRPQAWGSVVPWRPSRHSRSAWWFKLAGGQAVSASTR